jgi:hypothetical protein
MTISRRSPIKRIVMRALCASSTNTPATVSAAVSDRIAVVARPRWWVNDRHASWK